MAIHIQVALIFSLSVITSVLSVELMGGHYDNLDQRQPTASDNKFNLTNSEISESESATEELIPDPSALIIPGYNLPGHLFNDGKPFYVEKDPLTGAINFNNKTPAGKEYSSNEYDYIYDEPSADIYDKANIDRKDGGYGSHRPNDVNQLSPNFHDFLPVKYSNPDKYAYPLISSSYANTKIQGNVNSYNHKQISGTTYKPTVSPMYYTTRSVYYKPSITENYVKTTTTTTTTTPSTYQITTNQQNNEKPLQPTDNLMNSPMNHPSYLTTVESDYDYDYYTSPNPNDQGMYLTTEPPRKEVYITNKPQTTTKKPYSIFDDLFGDYEEPEPIEKLSKPPSLFSNLPAGNFDSYDKNNKVVVTPPTTTTAPTVSTTVRTTTTMKPTTTTAKPVVTQLTTKRPEANSHYSNSESVSQVFPEEDNNMYEYVDDYNNNYNEDIIPGMTSHKPEITTNKTKYEVSTQKSVVFNIRNETKTTTERNVVNQTYSNFHQNYLPTQNQQFNTEIKQNITRYSDRFDTLPAITTEKQDNNYISITSEKYNYFNEDDVIPYKTTKTPEKYTQARPEASTSTKVTSMPLGENHPNVRLPPVFTLTQNIKESLNREKVDTTTKSYLKPVQFEQKENYPDRKQPERYPDHKQPERYPDHKQPERYPDHKQQERYPDHKQSVLHQIPSTSNIRIAPDQDMVSFVVGNHQNVDGGQYVGTSLQQEPFMSNSFRPLYTQQNSVPVFDQVIYNRPVIKDNINVNYIPQPPQITNANIKNETSFINVGTSTTINVQPAHGSQSLNVQPIRGLQSINVQPMHGSQTINVKPLRGPQTINVQPIHGSQASLSIGMPADEIKTVPGQVVDEKLDINDNVEFPKEPGTKVVFPEDDFTTYTPPPKTLPNREILSLYSKPMFHQLPSDLTPPSEPEIKPPMRNPGSPRPPWDPRPGHFYQGRPEYARPPRPHKPEVFKRIDGLPNILPQFRPNAKVSNNHYMDSIGTINAGYMPRQPLLDRPSNRPIGFFEKLHPPPPPKGLHNLRKVTALEPDMKHDRYRYEERILNLPNIKPHQDNYGQQHQDNYGPYQMPPKVPVANRKSEDESEIATLQMIQAKQSDKLETIIPNVPPPFKINYQESTEKPLYVVYPVNSSPLKLDVLDNDKRETVVVGTRGEQLPLPPSKITQEPQQYEQKPLLKPKDRNDSPILKPHSRPNTFPVKSDFPYILEKPDPTLMNVALSSSSPADLVPNLLNNLDTTISTPAYNINDYINVNYQSNNQWTSLDTEPRIVNGGNKGNYLNDQISATLKTYTDKEKPIAIAYTPTEPSNTYNVGNDKYSVPNFGRPVISEIRPEPNKYGTVSNDDSEFTVSAVMHTHPQLKLKTQNEIKYFNPDQNPMQLTSTRRTQDNLENHKLNLDVDTTHIPAKLDFQAPFHASVSIDSEYQGWSVVNSKSEIDRADVDNEPSTTAPETSSEFDIENFKPQLFGGFKPIYTYPNEKEKTPTTDESERQE